jgi:hypothetical protein
MVEADTAMELVEYHRQYAPNASKPPKAEWRRDFADRSAEPMPEVGHRLVKLLYSANTALRTTEVAQALGLQHPRGVGGFVTSLTAWGKHLQLSKKAMLVKGRSRSPSGKFVRTMALTDNFRRMIRDGKIPGMSPDIGL